MNLRTLMVAATSILFSLCVVFGVVSLVPAQAAEKETAPSATLKLHFSLRLSESGEPKLYLDMPVNEEFLRLLMNGQEKHRDVFLAASKGVPYGEVVKVIDMLSSLGMHKLSLDTKHEKAAPMTAPKGR